MKTSSLVKITADFSNHSVSLKCVVTLHPFLKTHSCAWSTMTNALTENSTLNKAVAWSWDVIKEISDDIFTFLYLGRFLPGFLSASSKAETKTHSQLVNGCLSLKLSSSEPFQFAAGFYVASNVNKTTSEPYTDIFIWSFSWLNICFYHQELSDYYTKKDQICKLQNRIHNWTAVS